MVRVGGAGEEHPGSRLSEREAREIIALRWRGVSLAELAARYRVSVNHVSNMARGVRWAHLGIEPVPLGHGRIRLANGRFARASASESLQEALGGPRMP